MEAWAVYLADLAGPSWAQEPMTPTEVAREVAINVTSVPGMEATLEGSDELPSVVIRGRSADEAAAWHMSGGTFTPSRHAPSSG